VASVKSIERYCSDRGFVLENAITTSKLGCNQFSLRRRNVPDTSQADVGTRDP